MNSSLIFSFSFLILLSGSSFVFADHSSGGGGSGCSGDCTPPTLGSDDTGRVFVENGFSINDVGFDVSSFQQDIPTQFLYIGEPASISVKIYENTGPSYLTHVFLMLGQEEQTISGIKVPTHPVQIIWENSLEGTPSVTVDDPNNLLSNITVDSSLGKDAFGNKDKVSELVFRFTPIQKFNTDVVLVKTWDFKNNAWTNYFYQSIVIEDAKPNSLENNAQLEENISEPKVPSWFKNNAGFWAHNQINDDTFIVGIKYMIEQKIINISNLERFEPQPLVHFVDPEKGSQYYVDRYYRDKVYQDWFDSNFPELTIEEAVGLPSNTQIPDWIKNNASLWAENQITDSDFLNGIEFLVNKGIILI